MKQLFFAAIMMMVMVACSTKTNTEQAKNDECCSAKKSAEMIDVSVDSVLSNPELYLEKSIVITGRVVHTCKHSGKKMFLAGSDENIYVKVTAEEGISRFEETLEGEMVKAKGILTPITDDGENHEEGSCATESKTKEYVLACTEFEVIKNI
jgi:hypothetical protein